MFKLKEAIFPGRWAWQGVGVLWGKLMRIYDCVCQTGHRLNTSWAVFVQGFGNG